MHQNSNEQSTAQSRDAAAAKQSLTDIREKAAAQARMDKNKTARQLSDEKQLLMEEVQALKAAAQDDSDTADSIQAGYEQQIKATNEEVLLLQTATLQYKREKNEREQELKELRGSNMSLMQQLKETQQSQELVTTEQAQLVQQASQQKDELAVLKAAATDHGATASYEETMKAAYEMQIRELNEELMMLQTTTLQSKRNMLALRSAEEETNELNAKLSQSEKMLRSEKSLLEREVEALKAAAKEDGDDAAYADAMKVAYEDQIKGLNEELMMLQTSMMQYKKDVKVFGTQVAILTDERDTAQQQAIEFKLLSQDKAAVEQELKALRTVAQDNGDAALYSGTVKEAHEQQIKDTNKEMMGLQTTLLQQRKEKQLVDDRVAVMEQQAADALTVHEQTVQQLMAAEQATKVENSRVDLLEQQAEALKSASNDDGDAAVYADTVKSAYEDQIKGLNEEVMVLQTTMMQFKIVTKKEKAQSEEAIAALQSLQASSSSSLNKAALEKLELEQANKV